MTAQARPTPRAHAPSPLLLPSLVGEGGPQGGRLPFSQAPRRCGLKPSPVQIVSVKGGVGALSVSSPSSLQPGCVPSRSRGSSHPDRVTVSRGGGNKGCERPQPVRGRSELGAPDSMGCAYRRRQLTRKGAPGPQPHCTHPGRPWSGVPGGFQQLPPGLAPSAGGHKVRGGWEHRPAPHAFHNLTDGAMEQEG